VRICGAVIDELRSLDWISRRVRSRTTGSPVVRFGDLPEAVMGCLEDKAQSPEKSAEHADTWRTVRRLPRREASIIVWYYFDEMDFAEIASRLGVSKPRVSQLHTRALRRLRGLLADETLAA
jgi:RNA polymerase sigma factor (sigma-70 family)